MPPSDPPSVVNRLRVFLAEDDLQMRRLLATALRRDGHFVLEAQDGPGLLMDLGHVFWGGHDDPTTPSVIVSDVRLPGRDGLAILRGIRTLPWCPPVILMTAFGDRGLHAHAAALGAHAVLDKPFALAQLRDLLARVASPPAGSPPGNSGRRDGSAALLDRGK